MTEDEARLKYWEAVEALRIWIEYGPDSKKEVLDELNDDLEEQHGKDAYEDSKTKSMGLVQ